MIAKVRRLPTSAAVVVGVVVIAKSEPFVYRCAVRRAAARVQKHETVAGPIEACLRRDVEAVGPALDVGFERATGIVQSPKTSVAGGAIATAPLGRCERTYGSDPLSSSICVRHSGSAESAHGASPLNGATLAVAFDGSSAFGGAGTLPGAIRMRIRSRCTYAVAATATASTRIAAMRKYRVNAT